MRFGPLSLIVTFWRYSLLTLRHQVLQRLKTLVMPGLIVGLWVMSSGVVEGVSRMGIPHLFWHDSTWYYVCSCLSLGVFVGVWCWVSLLLSADRKWMRDGDPVEIFGRRLTWPGLGEYSLSHVLCYLFVSSIWICLLLATAHPVYVLVNWLPTGNDVVAGLFGSWGLMLAGSAVFLLFQAILFRTGSRDAEPQRGLGRYIQRSRERLESYGQARGEPRMLAPVWLHRNALLTGIVAFGTIAITVLISFVAKISVTNVAREPVPAVAVVSTLLILFVLAYGPFVYYRRQGIVWTIVLTALLIGAIFYGYFRKPQYPIRGLEGRVAYAKAIEQSVGPRAKPATVSEASDRPDTPLPDNSDSPQLLDAWRNRFAADERPKLVVVAVSGGGISAQVWTTTVLCALERRLESFPQQVRLITGTSGGMVGATYYAATLADDAQATTSGDRTYHVQHPLDGSNASEQASSAAVLSHERILYNMSRDALTPVVKTYLFSDLAASWLRNFVPTDWQPNDRGRTLEDAWAQFTKSDGGRSPLDLKLRDLAPDEASGRRPVLVYAPTIAEDGRRMLVSNWHLDELITTEAGYPAADPLSISALQVSRVFPQHEMRLKTAARLNANFPFIVASPALPTDPGLHIMDAGYYDNYGVDLAGRWLYANRKQLADMDLSGILLVQISSSSLNRLPDSGPTTVKPSTLPEVGGFITTSFQKAVFTSDHYLQLLGEYFNREDATERNAFFRVEPIEFRGDVSLSWYLTPAETYALILPFLADEQDKVAGPFSADALREVFRDEFACAERVHSDPSIRRRHGEKFNSLDDTRDRCQAQLESLAEWWPKPHVSRAAVPDRP